MEDILFLVFGISSTCLPHELKHIIYKCPEVIVRVMVLECGRINKSSLVIISRTRNTVTDELVLLVAEIFVDRPAIVSGLTRWRRHKLIVPELGQRGRHELIVPGLSRRGRHELVVPRLGRWRWHELVVPKLRGRQKFIIIWHDVY